jgi:hypothetical protein
MSETGSSRPVSTAQVVGILTSTLALFFMVAFATKSVDAYRLRNWRDRLRTEIADLTDTRIELEEEVRRRQSVGWVEEALRDAGQLSDRTVGVVAVAATPPAVAVAAAPATGRAPASVPAPDAFFANAPWRAWWRLIRGFD